MRAKRATGSLGVLLLFTLTDAAAPSKHAVPWSQVRAAFSETICVVPLPEPHKGYWVSIGERVPCGLAPASTPLERAVDVGFKEARPLLVTVPSAYEVIPKGIDKAYAAEDAAERNRIAGDMILDREELLRPLVPRLIVALSREGLTCTDCPVFDPPAVRTLTWGEFFPYFSGFISADPVKTPVGEDGRPPGELRYSFHICSGLDPGRAMRSPDPTLLRAGFVSAFGQPVVRTQVGEHFMTIIGEPTFQALTQDDARTEYLRKRLTEELRKDSVVAKSARRTLKTYVRDLGVRLKD